jgi:hypothetical protein
LCVCVCVCVCVIANEILKLQTYTNLGACYCTFRKVRCESFFLLKSELSMHMVNYVRTYKGF